MLWRHPVATGRQCNLAIFIVGFLKDEVFLFSLIIFTSNYLYLTERQTDRETGLN